MRDRITRTEKVAEKASGDHYELSVYRKSDTYLFMAQGEVLHKLKSEEVYKLTNGGMSWEDYLKQPELSLTTGQARQRIECYQFYILTMGMSLEDVGWYPLPALKYILSLHKKGKLKTATEVKQIMEAAKQLSLADLKDFVQDKDMEGVQQAPRTYEYVIMKRCKETNNLTKVHDISSEDIKSKFNLTD